MQATLNLVCLLLAVIPSTALVTNKLADKQYAEDEAIWSVLSTDRVSCLQTREGFPKQYMQRALELMNTTFLSPLYDHATMEASSCESKGFTPYMFQLSSFVTASSPQDYFQQDSCFKGLNQYVHRQGIGGAFADFRRTWGEGSEWFKSVWSNIPTNMSMNDQNERRIGKVQEGMMRTAKPIWSVCDNFHMFYKHPCFERDDSLDTNVICDFNTDKILNKLEAKRLAKFRKQKGGKPQCGVVFLDGWAGTSDFEAPVMSVALPERLREAGLDCEYSFPKPPIGYLSLVDNPNVSGVAVWLKDALNNKMFKPRRWMDIPDNSGCPDEMEEKMKHMPNPVDMWGSMRENIPTPHQEIRGLMAKGVPADKIFVVGYCQGGTIAFQSAIEFPERLGGIILFYAPLIGGGYAMKDPEVPKSHMAAANKGQNVLYFQDPHDPVVMPCSQDFSANLAHSIDPKMNLIRQTITSGHTRLMPKEATDSAIAFMKQHM